MANSQAILFLLFALDGVIVGILFDFFRILRRSFSTGNILTSIEDIIFWISVGIILLYSIFVFNNGVIRGYMFLGVFLGVALYMLTLSKIFIKINVFIIQILKKFIGIIIKILETPIKIIWKITRKIFINPLLSIFIKVKKFMTANFFLNISKNEHKAKN